MLKRARKITQVRQYSEALKRQVVLEFESGRASARELMADYDILCKGSIYNWGRKYGKVRRETKVVRVIMKSEKERIKELEKAVAELTLRNLVQEKELELWEEEGRKGLKKKFNTEQLKELEALKAKRAAIQSGSSVVLKG